VLLLAAEVAMVGSSRSKVKAKPVVLCCKIMTRLLDAAAAWLV
jgi:hypothetical protein